MNKKKFIVLLCICFGLFLLGYKILMFYVYINGGDWLLCIYNWYWMSELNDNVCFLELFILGIYNLVIGMFLGIVSGYVKI